MHKFTVIRGKLAAKTITPAGSLDYDLGARVSAEVVEVADLFDLYDLLRGLERDRTACIVRGAPRGERGLLRRYLERDGEDPGFDAQDVSWFCLDLDKVPAPHGFEQDNPLGEVDRLLPAPLVGAPLIWQYSASHGLPGRERIISAHLWFLTDRAVSCKSIKTWIKHMGVGDLALYQPVQPHYTAAPIFAGVSDPLPRRLWLSTEDQHRHEVPLPSHVLTCADYAALEDAATKARQAAARAAAQARAPLADSQARRYALRALERACAGIIEAGTGERHVTLRTEAWALRRFVLAGDLADSLWEGELRAAAESVLPASRHGEIARLLEGARKQT